MLPLISVVIVILSALGLGRLLPVIRKHRRQVRFIRESLTSSRKSDGRRVIASLSTVPERTAIWDRRFALFSGRRDHQMRSWSRCRNFRFGNNDLTRCRNMFRVGRVYVFCVVAGIVDQRQSLSPSFAKNWLLAGGIH